MHFKFNSVLSLHRLPTAKGCNREAYSWRDNTSWNKKKLKSLKLDTSQYKGSTKEIGVFTDCKTYIFPSWRTKFYYFIKLYRDCPTQLFTSVCMNHENSSMDSFSLTHTTDGSIGISWYSDNILWNFGNIKTNIILTQTNTDLWVSKLTEQK